MHQSSIRKGFQTQLQWEKPTDNMSVSYMRFSLIFKDNINSRDQILRVKNLTKESSKKVNLYFFRKKMFCFISKPCHNL